jgi:hypothetical protein
MGQPAAVRFCRSTTPASAGAISGAAATVSVPPDTAHSPAAPASPAAGPPDVGAGRVDPAEAEADANPDALLDGSDDPDRTSQDTTPAAATSATTTPTTISVRWWEGAERWRPRAAGGWSVMTSGNPFGVPG